MRVLYVYHFYEEDVQHDIINFLRKKGIEVVVEPVTGHVGEYCGRRFGNSAFQKKHKKMSYDFMIFVVHTSNVEFRSFQRAVKPVVGFIDLEHDLLKYQVEHSIKYGKSSILTFHNRHYKYARKSLTDKEIIKCRWPKLDLIYEPLTFNEINKKTDAIIVATRIFAPIIKEKKEFGQNIDLNCFENLWYKNYKKSESFPCGTKQLPDQFVGPGGVKYCLDAVEFILTVSSGMFVETLLFGGLPILLMNHLNRVEKIDDIVSEVSFIRKPYLGMIKAITVENLSDKVERLRNDRELFEKVHQELCLEWFDEDYYTLPSAKESIWNFIERACTK